MFVIDSELGNGENRRYVTEWNDFCAKFKEFRKTVSCANSFQQASHQSYYQPPYPRPGIRNEGKPILESDIHWHMIHHWIELKKELKEKGLWDTFTSRCGCVALGIYGEIFKPIRVLPW